MLEGASVCFSSSPPPALPTLGAAYMDDFCVLGLFQIWNPGLTGTSQRQPCLQESLLGWPWPRWERPRGRQEGPLQNSPENPSREFQKGVPPAVATSGPWTGRVPTEPLAVRSPVCAASAGRPSRSGPTWHSTSTRTPEQAICMQPVQEALRRECQAQRAPTHTLGGEAIYMR